MSLSQLSDKELLEAFERLNESELQEQAKDLSPEKISDLVSAVEESLSAENVRKISALIRGMQTKEQVEAVGKVLNTHYSLALMQDVVHSAPEEHWKFSALIVGLSHRVFLNLLVSGPEAYIRLIQHEALIEPVQHHLTLFVHEAESDLNHRVEELERFEASLHEINAQQVTMDDIRATIAKIRRFDLALEGLTILVNRALSVAWNSNRPDLVERLSDLKESLIRTKNELIGIEEKETGLFGKLKEELSSVFGGKSEENIHALEDGEPGVEALARLGLWEVEEYWEVGLLPKYKTKEALTEKLYAPEGRALLLDELQESLQRFRLTTVNDFKDRYLFTKALLKDYVSLRTS